MRHHAAVVAALVLTCATLGHATPPAPARRAGTVVRIEHREPATPPSRGPAFAPVTIELFFQPAPRLAAALPTYRALERLAAAHRTRVRLVYRVIKRPSNGQLAIAALEAQAQGHFFDLMDELHLQRTPTSLTREQVLELATKVGMDARRVDAAISEGRYGDAFAESEHRLQRLLNGSLPGVLFNSQPGSDRDLEHELGAAYDRAQDLLDEGVPLPELAAAFDARARRAEAPYVARPPSREDPDDRATDEAAEPPLASPALDLTGLPSYGPAAEPAEGTIPVVLLCLPSDTSCNDSMRALRNLQQSYASEVRILWAPWFDVAQDDATELILLADAALCAERVGSSPKELSASAGWTWVTRFYELARRGPAKDVAVEDLIDAVDRDLGIVSAEMSACRASHANTALEWVTAARRAGVRHAPALVIGGRIYEGLTNGTVIDALVKAELAPGMLGEAAPDFRGHL